MEQYPYWRRQTHEQPLYPNLEWSKPEQRSQAGRLAIVGGNQLGFVSAVQSYALAQEAGVGAVRVLLPDALKKVIPATITDAVYAPTNPSGSLSKDAASDLHVLSQWANEVLLIGDAGRNSETAILYERFMQDYQGPLMLTRDAIDLMKNSNRTLVDRPNTVIIASFAQVQKLFQSVYYPKVLTFSMHLPALVEALHKFTITYPVCIAVLHRDTLIAAHDGEVTTTPWQNAMAIWRGSVATKAAAYWLWNQSSPLKALTGSFLS